MTFLSTIKAFVALTCACLLAAACASDALPTGNAAYEIDRGLEYRLGPGDKVRITVFDEEQLSGEFLVANNGGLAIPLLGEVPAGGRTTSELRTTIQDRLEAAGMVRSARVSVDVTAYRPFYILGEVAKPGQYPYSIGMTLTKAIATAGGFTYRANNKVVYLTREGSTREIPVALTAATAIGPGDTIRVGERYF